MVFSVLGRCKTENEETHGDSDEECPNGVGDLFDCSYEKDVADLLRRYVLDVSPEPMAHLESCEDGLGNRKALGDGVSG